MHELERVCHMLAAPTQQQYYVLYALCGVTLIAAAPLFNEKLNHSFKKTIHVVLINICAPVPMFWVTSPGDTGILDWMFHALFGVSLAIIYGVYRDRMKMPEDRGQYSYIINYFELDLNEDIVPKIGRMIIMTFFVIVTGTVISWWEYFYKFIVLLVFAASVFLVYENDLKSEDKKIK
jgi:cbb3-type cytochrome oxidase subunit 3